MLACLALDTRSRSPPPPPPSLRALPPVPHPSRIKIVVVDTNSLSGPKPICTCDLSFNEIRTDQLDTQWRNMYGVRPLPKSAIGVGNIAATTDDSAELSAYRGRILLYAAADEPKPEETLATMQLPRIYSKSEMDALMPRVADYRCESRCHSHCCDHLRCAACTAPPALHLQS